MEYLERSITVFDPSYVKPIYVVQNSNMFEIRITITDWNIPADADVYWQVATKTKGELNSASLAGNTIYINPYNTTFSEAGKGYLQVRIESGGKLLVSFSIDVFIQEDRVASPVEGSNSDVIRALVNQYVEEATEDLIGQVQSVVNELIESIPSDYTELEARVDELEESQGGGLSNEAKQALLACFAKVAWIDEDGQDYYDALENALYPPANLVSITAVYTQSGTVYDSDSLDDLKAGLVVTANYDDETSQGVTDYTLSGTLTVGTSAITVMYGGQTDTFNVTVSRDPQFVVRTVTGVTAPITIGSITLTDGYINDSGEITGNSSNKVYNEFVEGNSFVVINSSNVGKSMNYRTAGYGPDKSFLGRNYYNGVIGGAYSGASFIKMGFGGSVEATDAFIYLPYLLSDVCTIANTRISNTGEEQSNNSYYSSDYIPITTTGIGAVSSINSASGAYVTGIAFYDENKQFISYSQGVSNGNRVGVFEITASMKYCRFTTSTPNLSSTSLIIEDV